MTPLRHVRLDPKIHTQTEIRQTGSSQFPALALRLTDFCDSSQRTGPSPQSAALPSTELMTPTSASRLNWGISPEVLDISTTPATSGEALALMHAVLAALLGLWRGSYLSHGRSSGRRRCHADSLLDYPHGASPPPPTPARSSCDDTGWSSQGGADLTHSPQSAATSHMPASPVIPVQRKMLLSGGDKLPL